MTSAESRYPDVIADVISREELPAPYLRIHDEDFGDLYLVQSPQSRAWVEDPEQTGRPLHLLVWLGVFPPVSGALLEVHSFDAATSGEEEELARWLFGGGDASAPAEASGRVDPRMRALLMFQEAQLMGARTTEARTPKYNPLRSLKLRLEGETRARYRRLRDDFPGVWSDARRALALALDAHGREAEAYAASLSRIVVEQDLVQLQCVVGATEAVFTMGASGPLLHPIPARAAPGT
jgi:hypothetical protein